MSKTSNMVKIQVPIEADVRDRFEAYVKNLGFDSIQAYIRVWAKAKADGREIDFDDVWGQPTPEAAARLQKAARDVEHGIDIEGPFNTVEGFMKGLRGSNNKTDYS
ncbi:MAG: hypothetical protein U0520_01455 [Candidatus Saccharimonadales bacterium]